MPLQIDACKKFNIRDPQTQFYLTFVLKNGAEIKLDDNEILWRKIDTNRLESRQVFIRHVNLGAKELTITLYAGVVDTPVASVKLSVNIMCEAKDVVIAALKEFGLDDVS